MPIEAVPPPDQVRSEPPVAAAPHGTRISRRTLLRRAGLVGAGVVVAGAGATGYRAYDTGVFDVGEGPAYAPWRSWSDDPGPRGLVAAALLAPSPHNAQAWRFRVGRHRVAILRDPARQTGVIDPYGRELEIGLGAALENLVLAASARGYAVELVPAPDTGDPALAATVHLSRGPRRASELYRAIPHRHSNRYAFSDRAIASSALDPMRRLAADLAPAEIVVLSDPARLQRLGGLVVSATQAMLTDHERSQEDARWMRQSWTAIQEHRDGITLDAAGLSDWLVALAKILPAQSAGANDAAWLSGTRGRQVSTARAFGVVTVPDPEDPQQRLLGGRLLERAHLWATVHGLALQHMNAVTERADRERQLALPDRFASAYSALMPERHQRPIATFRLGYPTHAGRPSPRRPVGWVAT
jgi:hypothetical protein